MMKENNIICTNCDSSTEVSRRYPAKNIIFNILAIGIPLFFSAKKWICKNCNHKWKEKIDWNSSTIFYRVCYLILYIPVFLLGLALFLSVIDFGLASLLRYLVS